MEPSRSHPPSSGHPGPLRARKGEGNGKKRERKQERDRTVINHTLACLLSIRCPVMTVCLGPRGASKHITVNKHPQPSHAAVLPHTHKNTHRRTKKKKSFHLQLFVIGEWCGRRDDSAALWTRRRNGKRRLTKWGGRGQSTMKARRRNKGWEGDGELEKFGFRLISPCVPESTHT